MSGILNRETFLQDLAKLVGFETVTGQENGFSEAFEFIKGKLHPNAYVTELENGGTTMLLASNTQSLEPDVCFLVHVDVVSADPNQFMMEIEGDVVRGRGVRDMKYSIPMSYELLNRLIEENSELTFTLAVTSDEERGGFQGAGYLAEEYGLRPGLVICPDGGENFDLIHKNKGVCHIRVMAEGKSAHSSRLWNGENALEPVVRLADQLFKKYKAANSKEGCNTTLNIGILQGGDMINRVPSDAHMDLDFRFVPEVDSAEGLEEMVREMANAIDPAIQMEILAIGDTMFTSPTNPVLELFVQILSDAVGRNVNLEGGHGSNDARHFNRHGSPVIMSRPLGEGEHSDDEWLDVPSTLLFAQVVYQFLQSYLEMLNTPISRAE